MDRSPHHSPVRTLARTDPHVRHRADGLLLVAGGLSFTTAATRLGCARSSLRTWSQRVLAEGHAGLVDRRRQGRPQKLDTAARELVDDDSPVTTVYRTVHAMDDCYRRPRHDLRHRQDAEAVASATHVLAELQKRGLMPGLDCALSPWMHATAIPPSPGTRLAAPRTSADRAGGRQGPAPRGLRRASGHVIWQLHAKQGGDAFAGLLAQSAQPWPDAHLILVMDHVRDHRSPWSGRGGPRRTGASPRDGSRSTRPPAI